MVKHPSNSTSGVVCGSPQMRATLALATRAGARDSQVLITGESGVGKDVLARYLHASSPRAARPFIAVNCAGLAETLLESELFGHVRGSFTGAYRDKPGKLQMAHGGTIFLDEVGEMTPRMQALLLRFLESGEVQPVGGDTTNARVDARVVTATNRDLPKMAALGQFREDLMYRIRVVHLHVSPLRERRDDIRPLLEHFIAQLDPSLQLTPEAWSALEAYHWPGNVRELRNMVEQWSALGSARAIALEDLPWRPAPAVAPAPIQIRDRRRGAAEALYQRITTESGCFWTDVVEKFIDRELTRQDVRSVIARGLDASGGSYRELLRLFRMEPQDYKRLLNFLVRHNCTVDFRAFRRRPDDVPRATAPARPWPPDQAHHATSADRRSVGAQIDGSSMDRPGRAVSRGAEFGY
jgi:DNA-binding NtrC family response regulator